MRRKEIFLRWLGVSWTPRLIKLSTNITYGQVSKPRQKQRLSIARAIIKNPEILLLDDCLSAVDTETEEKILNNLNVISKGKTTIIVSHRISSAKNADKIIVLDNGEIVQEGTHENLINTDGYYKNLYLKQLSTKEIH